MRKRLTILLFLLLNGAAFAQKIPDYGFNKVRIALNDRIIQADLAPLRSDPAPQSDKTYYWSSSNAIHTTQGGFSGKLLNGSYVEYYLSKNLKEQGQFRRGLKNGIWKSWSGNGTLTELYTWDDGVRSGKFELFGSDGKLRQTGYYSNNLLHGKMTTYADGKSETVEYKDGKIAEKKPSAFWGKINPLKWCRKDSTDTAKSQPAKQAQ